MAPFEGTEGYDRLTMPEFEIIGVRSLKEGVTRVADDLEAGKWFLLKRNDVVIGAILPLDAVEVSLAQQPATAFLKALRQGPGKRGK